MFELKTPYRRGAHARGVLLLITSIFLLGSVLIDLFYGGDNTHQHVESFNPQDIETTAFLHENGQREPFNNIRDASIGKVTIYMVASRQFSSEHWHFKSFTTSDGGIQCTFFGRRLCPDTGANQHTVNILKLLLEELEKPVATGLKVVDVDRRRCSAYESKYSPGDIPPARRRVGRHSLSCHEQFSRSEQRSVLPEGA
jgi:hypothetical protein